jgi:hypothetical protein
MEQVLEAAAAHALTDDQYFRWLAGCGLLPNTNVSSWNYCTATRQAIGDYELQQTRVDELMRLKQPVLVNLLQVFHQ